MTASGPFRSAMGLLGAACVGLAAVLVVAPGTATTLLPVDALASSAALSAGDARAAAFAIVGVACLCWVAWTSGGAAAARAAVGAGPDAVDRPGTDDAPEPGSDGDVEFPTLEADPSDGDDSVAAPTTFDRRLARTLAAAERGEGGDDVREAVRSLAIDVVAHVEGCPREAAADLVDRGTWTDDAVATAYVADREAALPLLEWADGWFRPRTAKARRVRRAIDAIRDRLDGRGSPPAAAPEEPGEGADAAYVADDDRGRAGGDGSPEVDAVVGATDGGEPP